MIFSKVIDGIVQLVVNVTDLQWIIDNPDRYGDAALYVETDPTDWHIVWGQVGFAYDYDTGLFSDPNAPPVPDETTE